MSRYLPKSRTGRAFAFASLFAVAVLGVFVIQRAALAAPYVNPFWANGSASQESAIPSVSARAMVVENGRCSAASCGTISVDVRTGELFWDHTLFRTPGVLQDNVFGLRWRSMITGASQLGRQMLPSWEVTVQYVLLNPANPNGPNGHRVDVRQASGRIDPHTWNGAIYVSGADVFDTLTVNGGGQYVLTDKWGGWILFDVRGMPQTRDDPNGNVRGFTYNVTYQMTGYTDERGKTYTIAHNANGYMSSIADPCGRTWTFTYDAADNLKTITTPTTPDQPTGIVTTLNYDGTNRLISIKDGRGNTVWSFAYNGAGGQIATVTAGTNAIGYAYVAGMTTRTDRNGNVHRHYHTGTQITKTETMVGATPKYVTLHRYV